MPLKEKRKEKRISIDSIVFPLLGSKEVDHSCFQYLPLDISLHGLKIAIPKWVVNRDSIEEKALINLHIPFQYSEQTYMQGRVMWTHWEDVIQALTCGIQMERKTSTYYSVYISLETKDVNLDLRDFSSLQDLLLKVIKDSFLLKKGVLIYLNHLIPYFSRITKYPHKEYPMLKEYLLEDIKNKVNQHEEILETLYNEMLGTSRYQSEIAKYLDLEELRSIMESEIYAEILKTAFETDAILPYLNAIKELEKKLYNNYNTIVMIYIKSL